MEWFTEMLKYIALPPNVDEYSLDVIMDMYIPRGNSQTKKH